jgi:predicted O-methyltransferase YrrM
MFNHFYENILGWATQQEQGALLQLVLPEQRHIRLAEIGVYHGRGTALWLVQLLGLNKSFDYYAIDEWHLSGMMASVVNNLNPIWDRLGGNNLSLIRGYSVQASALFGDNYFDVVYIDANHEYESVKADIKHWLPKVKPNSYICGDDYCSEWPGVIKAVDEFINETNYKLIRIAGKQWAVKKQ